MKLYSSDNYQNQAIFLVSEPNILSENLLAMEIRKTKTLLNKSVYLDLSVLELSRIAMYEHWYDYVKPKLDKKKNWIKWMQRVSLYT